MLIGIPKEIKDNESRVGLTPHGAEALTQAGHQVVVQSGAGQGSGFSDEDYIQAGALIVRTAEEVYGLAEMIVKVKEPQIKPAGDAAHSEVEMLREGQIVFSYLHLAAEPELTQALVDSKASAMAFETVTDEHGRLPLLKPMSEIAGRLSVITAANLLRTPEGGRGVLMGGLGEIPQANVVIIGGGVVGMNAAENAIGLAANVTILEKNPQRIVQLEEYFRPLAEYFAQRHGTTFQVLEATPENIDKYVTGATIVVGAVLIPGAAAPKLITEDMVSRMKKGAVIVDVAIDQGGIVETGRPTTHSNPTYKVHGVTHYCVTNMPGAVARSASRALEHATLPCVLEIANHGFKYALAHNKHLRAGLNVCAGHVCNEAVAEATGHEYMTPIESLARTRGGWADSAPDTRESGGRAM